MTQKIGCVVMAAGNARRFGENKLTASFEGKPMIQRTLEAVPEGLEAVVVTQYPEIERMAERFGFAAIRNTHPDWGISHTISLGTKYLRRCDAIVYLVSDQPLLKKRSVQAVIDRWRQEPDCIVGLSHGGKRGNPCIFPAAYYPELLTLTEDHGGNTVIRRHMDMLRLVEAAEGELADVDTPQALHELTLRSN